MKSSNELDLKNPFFRYTGQQPQPPPGNNHTSPSEAYWNQQDLTGICLCCLTLPETSVDCLHNLFIYIIKSYAKYTVNEEKKAQFT